MEKPLHVSFGDADEHGGHHGGAVGLHGHGNGEEGEGLSRFQGLKEVRMEKGSP